MTILGALSQGHLVCCLDEGTKTDTVYNYFRVLASRTDLDGAFVVLDNHPAHKAHKVLDFLRSQRCNVLFLPVATSVMNPVERVWASLKDEWRKRLLMVDPALANRAWMQAQLRQIHEEHFSPEALTRLAHSHYKAIILCLEGLNNIIQL